MKDGHSIAQRCVGNAIYFIGCRIALPLDPLFTPIASVQTVDFTNMKFFPL